MRTVFANRRTGFVLLIDLAVATDTIAGAAAIGVSDDPATDRTEANMTETDFPWGTVTHETDTETGATHVDVSVETEDDVSVSAVTVPDATNESTDHAETKQFSWGVVAYTIDSDTSATDVEVIVDVAANVSLSVTTVSDDGSQGSTAIATSAGEGGDVDVSQSTGSSQSSVSISQSTTAATGEDGSSVSIDIG